VTDRPGDFTEDGMQYLCIDDGPDTTAYMVSFLDPGVMPYGPVPVLRCEGVRDVGDDREPCTCGAWTSAVTVGGEYAQIHGLESERVAAREIRAHVRRATRKDM
jgi:hypothetical protein